VAASFYREALGDNNETSLKIDIIGQRLGDKLNVHTAGLPPMGIERYSISIHFARMLMNAGHRLQLDEAELLKEAGLNQRMLDNAHLRITPDQFSRLMRAVWRLADDEFLGMGSQRCPQGVFAIMAKQVIHSHNLHSVYYKLSHFYNVINDSLHLSLDIVGDEAFFRWRSRTRPKTRITC
jgi:hypothetical protein